MLFDSDAHLALIDYRTCSPYKFAEYVLDLGAVGETRRDQRTFEITTAHWLALLEEHRLDFAVPREYIRNPYNAWVTGIGDALSATKLPPELVSRILWAGGVLTIDEALIKTRRLAAQLVRQSDSKCSCWLDFTHSTNLEDRSADFVCHWVDHTPDDFKAASAVTYFDDMLDRLCEDCTLAVREARLNLWAVYVCAMHEEPIRASFAELMVMVDGSETLYEEVLLDVGCAFFGTQRFFDHH